MRRVTRTGTATPTTWHHVTTAIRVRGMTRTLRTILVPLGLALLVAHALTHAGQSHSQQADHAVIDFFAHLLVHACKYSDDAGAAALTAEFGQWVSESRAAAAGPADGRSSPDLLGRHDLFSALLQKSFPHAEGTEIEGTSQSLNQDELTV